MSLQLDHRLAADETVELAAHLAACPECAAEWAAWQRIDTLFSNAPAVQPRCDLTASIMARVRQEPRRAPAGRTVTFLGVGLAAVSGFWLALIVLVVAIMLLFQGPLALAVLAHGAASLLEWGGTMLEATRVLLWGVLRSPSLLIAVGYMALALAATAAWLGLLARQWKGNRA
jgi:anti-sigma factor RsiW